MEHGAAGRADACRPAVVRLSRFARSSRSNDREIVL